MNTKQELIAKILKQLYKSESSSINEHSSDIYKEELELLFKIKEYHKELSIPFDIDSFVDKLDLWSYEQDFLDTKEDIKNGYSSNIQEDQELLELYGQIFDFE